MPDDKKEKGLNLPAIRTGGLTAKKQSGQMRPLDLKKNFAMSQALNNDGKKSLQAEIAEREQGLDLVLVGDLTGSMQEYHSLLKNKFSSLSGELFQMIKNLRIGIIFYLDHDEHHPYVALPCPIGKNAKEMQRFISDAAVVSNGYTFDEAVEDAFNEIVNMQWREMGGKSVVLFGDARPHEPDDCPKGFDYFELVKKIHNAGIVVNCVFCGEFRGSSDDLQKLEDVDVGDFKQRVRNLDHPNFFSWVANVTGGLIIGVDKVEELIEIIKAAAAKDSGNLEKYELALKDSSPAKLKLIDIAKKAASRKRLADQSAPRLNHEK